MSCPHAPGSSDCSSGSGRSPTSSAPLPTSRFPSGTRPSARSRDSRRARAWRRSTPSRPRYRSVGSKEEEELLEALKRLKVSDVLVQSLTTISSLAWQRLSEEDRDLAQARLAIESLRAVVPLLADAVPPELVRDLEQVTVNLQLAYAKAVET